MRGGLIEQTIYEIGETLKHYSAPAIYASFGKDSLVLVHLMRAFKLPVICHRPPYQRHKWLFAEKIAADWGLSVYDFPPEAVKLQIRDGNLYVVSEYSAGHNTRTSIVQRTEEQSLLSGVCGVDVLRRPVGQFIPAWDLAFCAHKNGDPGIGSDKMKIELDVLNRPNAISVAFPMRHWTEQDIFDYTIENSIEVHEGRYTKGKDRFIEKTNGEYNPDVVGGCFECVRRGGDSIVRCPKMGGMKINSIADQVPYTEFDNNTITS